MQNKKNMLKRIDQWLVRHNFKPIFNTVSSSNAEELRRKEVEEEGKQELFGSLSVFQSAIDQMDAVCDHLSEDLQGSNLAIQQYSQEIETLKQETKEEKALITKLEKRREKAQEFKQKLEEFLGPLLEED